jgi:hypothetical protein
MSNSKSVFETLNSINVNDKTETIRAGQRQLTYLSWAWAWSEVKKNYPNSTYTIYENADGLNYHHDGMTAWVKTGVTIEDVEHIEYLPVMNNYNKSIPLADITSFNVNSSIQRSLTKAIARHGLGLYIYAGEDLPESSEPEQTAPEMKIKLLKGDDNWDKVLGYIQATKSKIQFEDILNTFKTKYQISNATKNALEKVYNEA